MKSTGELEVLFSRVAEQLLVQRQLIASRAAHLKSCPHSRPSEFAELQSDLSRSIHDVDNLFTFLLETNAPDIDFDLAQSLSTFFLSVQVELNEVCAAQVALRSLL